MDSNSIRRAFVEYFERHDHLHLAGLPLVTNNPSVTTLFTIAGMQQMIPYFMGQEEPPRQNMVTVQQTMRTNDIGEVGDDTHETFFEMLGNFSVGGYFKREAIRFTWDFLTGTLGLPRERFWAVTYPGDDEARQAWIAVGIPAERIGETPDNWWGPPGTEGPCGPNSEIHFDRGAEYGCGREDCNPAIECCERFVEVWNDVFMSFYQDEDGTRRPLPWNNVDTGMGFERLTAVVQGVPSIFDTDLFRPIIHTVEEASGRRYDESEETTRSMRIVADHARAVTFIINAGVMPGSADRGYVLRRLIRRAALHGRMVGIDRPFLSGPIERVIDLMSDFYPELEQRRGRVLSIVGEEERRFLQTLARGLGIFQEIAARATAKKTHISGEDAFLLSDTYGFPLEMTEELARERGLTVDVEGFQRELAEQRIRARGARSTRNIATSPETLAKLAGTVSPTVFTGYDELRTASTISALVSSSEPVQSAEEQERIDIILTRTPFYAEAGGQVGDTGVIRSDTGTARVENTTRPFAGMTVHHAVVTSGFLATGDVVEAEVDAERRLHILPHHTGTHLLHKALQEVLGKEATQAGSLVAPDRLRFDFNWPRPLSDEEIREVEERINAAIWANIPVRKDVMPYEDAIAQGAMALFGEKYGDQVRVVSVGDWSKELCGGTHVESTGDIGSLLITSETGSSAGVRRIEAVAGAAAYAEVTRLREEVERSARALDTPPENLPLRAAQAAQQMRDQGRRIEQLTQRLASVEADKLVSRAESVDGFVVVADRIPADSRQYVDDTSDAVKSRLETGIVLLGTVVDGKPYFTMAVTRNLAERFPAGTILREAMQRQGEGGAGGHAEFARGGGRNVGKVSDVLEAALNLIREKVEGQRVGGV